MKMKLFRYGYLIRMAFDHGRFIPIIMKQRGVSRIFNVLSAEIGIYFYHLTAGDFQLNQKIMVIWPGQLMGM